MSEDRPLTEFTDAEGDSGDSESDGGDDAIPTGDDEPTTDNDEPTTTEADPATATYRWQPEGAACARCGTKTERQWRDDDEFVCPDCKVW